MSRILIAVGAFIGTISIVWVLTSRDGNQSLTSSLLQAQQADVYVQSGALLKKTSPTPTLSPIPSPTATLLVPQTLLTPSVSPTVSSTPIPTHTPTSIPQPTPTKTPTTTSSPTQFVPQNLVTPSPTPTATPPPTPTAATSTPTPTQTSTTTPTQTPASTLDIAVTSLTSPVVRGSGTNNASITIRTSSTASCSIVVTLPSGSTSGASGISGTNKTKIAQDNGEIQWLWTITANTGTGSALIKLTCTLGDQTASGQTTMEIVSSQ